jgi:hypothetical protein
MRIDRIIVNDGPIVNLDEEVSESSSIGFAGKVGKTFFLRKIHQLWSDFIDRRARVTTSTSSGILLSGVPGIPHPLWLWEGPGSPPGVTDESQVVYLSRPPTATEATYGGMSEQVRRIDLLVQSNFPLTDGLTDSDREFLRRAAQRRGLIYDTESFTFETTVGEPTVWVTSQNLPSTLVQTFRILSAVRTQARSGDVVLMDVPFDTQHLSEQRGLAFHVERIVCKELGGQLIITSNQPEILDRYHGPKLIQYILPN